MERRTQETEAKTAALKAAAITCAPVADRTLSQEVSLVFR